MSSTTGKEPGAAARLARLVRYAHEAQLSDATRALVRDALLAELGAEPAGGGVAARAAHGAGQDAAPAGGDRAVPAGGAAPRRGLAAESAAAAPAGGAQRSGARSGGAPAPEHRAASSAPTAPTAPIAFGRRPEQLELKIRQLAEAEATWEQLEPLVWELFTVKPTLDTAARILELAFLHGPSGVTSTVESVLVKLAAHARGFYSHVHPAVRAHLTARMWRERCGETLATLLFRDKDEDWLQPIERLFVFHSMAGGKDPATPYIYFRRFKRELIDAASELGAHVGLTEQRFLLAVGEMAVELGYDNDARELLEQIRPGSAEHDDALRLLLDVTVEKNKAGRSHYVELLMSQGAAAERLKLLSQFLSATRGLGGFKDRNRPALNEILKNPLEWLSEEPDAWATLSELLVANRDLDLLLPNLFHVFKACAARFHGPLLDGALWQGPMQMHAETARDKYWQGVALLHHYVNCGVTAEKRLWQARGLIIAASKTWRAPPPYEWRELHKAAVAWVAKNHYLMETDRQRMLQQLRVALDPDSVATVDVEEYLEHAEAPPLEVLAHLQDLAKAKGAPALEGRLILKRAQVAHLTNADLNRFWQLAAARQDHDLGWRIASVLHARKALQPSVRHAWEISGEKRAHYPYVPPAKQAVDRCLKGFSPRAARLAYASLHVGPVLPALLAILDPGASVSRVSAPAADSVEARAEKMLSGLSWLDTPKRRYRFSFESAVGGIPVPGFAQVLPSNPWSVLVAKLAERLGVNAWGWKLSRLHGQVEGLIPRLASRQDLKRHSSKVAKWLKDLTPEQRAAWQDLATLSRSLDDDKAMEALATFICRLATVMHQNHAMALQSLHAMRAPAAVIWDLEAWILSDAYGDIRQKLGTHNRVLVPNALQRLSDVVQAERAPQRAPREAEDPSV